MLVEFVGPQAVGKSTVAPIVADMCGLALHSGQGWHDTDGRRLSPREVRLDRARSVVCEAPMFFGAFRAYAGPDGRRLRYSFNVARRNRFARSLRGGVIESGPAHGLCQGASNFGAFDVGGLVRHLARPDLYVRLTAQPDVVIARLERREAAGARRWHREWIEHYETMLDRAMAGQHLITVDAAGTPAEVVELVIAAMSSEHAPWSTTT